MTALSSSAIAQTPLASMGAESPAPTPGVESSIAAATSTGRFDFTRLR
jgi:hypothetical protein